MAGSLLGDDETVSTTAPLWSVRRMPVKFNLEGAYIDLMFDGQVIAIQGDTLRELYGDRSTRSRALEAPHATLP